VTAITTHVLDTANGRPAAGVPVLLERADGEGWLRVGGGATDPGGRAPLGDAGPGHHRLTFETSGWSGFYPRVVIHFNVTAGEDHYHVPLLLSPYGYTTYRGS
jgi:5-hydroxyisourate hydrolase